MVLGDEGGRYLMQMCPNMLNIADLFEYWKRCSLVIEAIPVNVFHMVVKWHLHGAADKMFFFGLINGAVSKRISVKKKSTFFTQN